MWSALAGCGWGWLCMLPLVMLLAAAGLPAAPAPGNSGQSSVDPELGALYDQYCDVHHRDREALRVGFTDYLKKNPDSPFAAEICYILGKMYSTGADKPREALDLPRMYEFFGRAHEIYGKRYSVEHQAAWSYLAARPEASPEEKAEYYAWIRKAAAGLEPDEIHPVRRIGEAKKQNGPPELEPRLRIIAASAARRTHTGSIGFVEDNLLVSTWMSDLPALVSLAPGTGLAQKAQRKMTMAGRPPDDMMVADLAITAAGSDLSLAPESPGPELPAPGEVAAADPKSSAPAPPAPPSESPLPWAPLAASAIALSGVLGVVVVTRRRAGRAETEKG